MTLATFLTELGLWLIVFSLAGLVGCLLRRTVKRHGQQDSTTLNDWYIARMSIKQPVRAPPRTTR